MPNKESGQSLVELLVGLAIITIIISSIVSAIIFVLRSNLQATASRTAAALEEEMMNGIRSVAEGSWSNFYSVSPKGPSTTYRLSASSASLTIASGTEDITVNNITYIRSFSVENVNRDSGGSIAASGTEDPSTQKIIATVQWQVLGKAAELKTTEYLTRSGNEVFWFSDWSGADRVAGVAPPEEISCSATLRPGELEIKPANTSRHACWVGEDTCLRLVESPPTGDFQAEIKLDTLPPTGSGVDSYLGIIVSKDTSNFLRFEIQSGEATNRWKVNAHKVIGGVGKPVVLSSSNLDNLLTPFYIRVNRVGNAWTLSYSTDGTSFTNVGSFTQALDLSGASSTIGPHLGNQNGSVFLRGDFDYFRVNVGNYSDEFNSGGPVADPRWSFVTNDYSTYSVNSGLANRFMAFFDPTKWIFSNAGVAGSQSGPIGVELSAGEYYVTFYSYDSHANKKADDQPREQWYVLLEASDGTDVATSRPISDLPAQYDYIQEVTGTNINLSSSVARVTAIHAAYPDLSTANSIKPVCAAFDRIPDPLLKRPPSLAWKNYFYSEDIRTSSTAGQLTLVNDEEDGYLESSTFDTGVPKGAAFNTIRWLGLLGGGGHTTVKFKLATASCIDGETNPPQCTSGAGWGGTKTTGDGAFVGPDGSSATFYQPSGPDSLLSLSSIYHNNKRFFRYRIFLERDDEDDPSPVVTDVMLNWSP